VSLRKDKTPAEVLAEYRDRQACTMMLVAQVAPETLREPGTIPWYGIEYSLDDFIAYAYYGHKREHSAKSPCSAIGSSVKRPAFCRLSNTKAPPVRPAR